MKNTRIPPEEISVKFALSSGPGGQNVQKSETKAQVRWNLEESKAFSDEEKEVLKKKLGNQLTKAGDLIVSVQETRYQGQNLAIATERLQQIVTDALTPEKERIETKPTRSSREKRLTEKRKKGEKKKIRSDKSYLRD